MSETSRTFTCSPAAVFAVLADGWLYASWVVGASRIRGVDPDWPAKGSFIHHSVGAWPLLLDDNTEVLASVPDSLLRLKARAWPTGEADVRIDIDGTDAGCTVRITEDVAKGPGRLIPRPLRSALLGKRNDESLKRLAFLAEGQSR